MWELLFSVCCAHWPTTLWENKYEVHFFTLKFECHNRYNSYYCVILHVVILHNAIKTIQNVFCVCFKEPKPVSLKKKKKKNWIKQKQTTQEGWVKKCFLFNPDYLWILFCDFPLIARSGTSHVTISLIGCARVKVPGNEEAENYWHLNTWKLVQRTKQVSKN